jgi:hypothetical protein
MAIVTAGMGFLVDAYDARRIFIRSETYSYHNLCRDTGFNAACQGQCVGGDRAALRRLARRQARAQRKAKKNSQKYW